MEPPESDPDHTIENRQVWVQALRLGIAGLPRFLLPLKPRPPGKQLLSLRIVYVSLVCAWVIFGLVLPLLAPAPAGTGGPTWPVLLVAGSGFVALVAGFTLPRVSRASPIDDEAGLAAAFMAASFVRLALTSSTVLFGFVSTFIMGGWWIYPLGFAIGLVNVGVHGPSLVNVRRAQAEAPPGLDLWRALMAAPRPAGTE